MIYADAYDTAVVVLSYNGRDYHRSFFPLLVAEAEGLYDVILIDNASTDDTLSYVQQNFPSVKCLRLEENRGFTGGYIWGLSQLQGYRYMLMLSADFGVSPSWFSPLHSAMDLDPQMGACQPKIRYEKDPEYFEYAGAAGGFMDRDAYFFCRGRLFDTLEKDEGQYDEPIECFWASGGCLMMRAELYTELGGLEDSLYAHMEEIDLCWRMKNAGYSIWCIPSSTVFHVGGSVISYGSTQKLYFNFRNNLLIAEKNMHGNSYWTWLFKRLVLDGVAALHYITKGEWRKTWTIFRAHSSFYRMFPKYWKKRKENQKYLSGEPNTKGIYRKSITNAYFLSGKRKFSELDPLDFS